jgi:NAD dependent epimerase/dehydratase family enzyme
MATILISGGTGMIGSALQKFLVEKGHEAIILVRPQSRSKIKNSDAHVTYADWNVESGEIDKEALKKQIMSFTSLAPMSVKNAGQKNARKRY